MRSQLVNMNDLKKHYLVFDASNILYKTFYANKQHDVDMASGLAHHTALTTLNKYFKKFKPHKVIMAFDKPNWRKEYTKSDQCVSGKLYKGNRRQKMTPSEKEKFERFIAHVQEFEQLLREHTSVVCLSADGCEADDLIAIFTQIYENDRTTVVSADKDLLQLLRNPNVTLHDPGSGKSRSLDEWGNDADYFLFEKCFRGDASDNIEKAYPGIRKTRIQQAYQDDYLKNNIMKHERKIVIDGVEKEVKVEDLFKENMMLMNLTKQPEYIQKTAIKEIMHEMDNPGKYSYFHFLQFCGKYGLKNISKNAEVFGDMLSR